MPPPPKKVVVYGGLGFFGQILVDELIERTDAEIVVAGRRFPSQRSLGERVRFVRSDLHEFASIEPLLTGASVVVNCTGPYKGQPLNILKAAISSRVDYLDLAEDRDFVRGAHAFDEAARSAGIAVLSGLSVVPGLSALLGQALHGSFERVVAIRTFVAPGTHGSRGAATIRSLLSGVGRPLRIWRAGREIMARGWTEPEWIDFPPPIGRRLQHLAIEAADQDELSKTFAAQTIEFKAGSEFAWLNRSLALAGRVRARTGFPPLDRWAGMMRPALEWIGRFGTDAGGVIVEVTGIQNGLAGARQIGLTAARHGERIPSLPAAIAVDLLLRGLWRPRGVVPLATLIGPGHLGSELQRRGLELWLRPGKDFSWQHLNNLESISSASTPTAPVFTG